MFETSTMLQNLHSLAKQFALQNLSGSELQIAATLIRRWCATPDIIVLDSSSVDASNTSSFVLYAFCGSEKDDMLVDFVLTFDATASLMNLLNATTRWNTKWFLYGSPNTELHETEHKDPISNPPSTKSASQNCMLCDVAITSLMLHLAEEHSERFAPLPTWMLE